MLPPVHVSILKPNISKNATHKLFFIKIKENLPFRAAILAQEWKEEQDLTFKARLPGLAISAAASVLLLGFGALALFTTICGTIVIAELIKKFMDEQMEIEGHMVEVVYAERMMERGEVDFVKYPDMEAMTPERYLYLEAYVLQYYDQFRGQTAGEIQAKMEKYRAKATKWVDKYYGKVKRKDNQIGD